MLEWLKANFESYNNHIIVQHTVDGMISVEPEWLATQLGTNVPPTYDFLITIDIAKNGNWDNVFKYWKDEGIIE